ncbi:Ubiquitin carboxyl-terminal hydrolase [Zea mays]|uniref:Ubiquitin carboxyl-terminal hydrolase n=1 Tax=Zea mays TaxID=4577 RepID=A0A1D6E9D3_MAIZE|nr:Ubiquitin carboxyl-terminal hydrolase [Zea mays]
MQITKLQVTLRKIF